MKFDPKRRRRMSIRLDDYDYRQPGAYFITVVVRERHCLFGEIRQGEMRPSPIGLLSPQIDDWRAMVDSVMIDSAYDGQVFNVVLADAPEKKSDLVAGRYLLPSPPAETTVAVKITAMLERKYWL